jgi:hypothetical protein
MIDAYNLSFLDCLGLGRNEGKFFFWLDLMLMESLRGVSYGLMGSYGNSVDM